MKKLFVIALLMSIALSCNAPEDTSNKKIKKDREEKLETKQDSINNSNDTVNSDISSKINDADSIENTGPKEANTEIVVDKSTEVQKETNKDNAVNIGDVVDTDTVKSVMDKPGYVGTPCKYVEGECIRHDHNK